MYMVHVHSPEWEREKRGGQQQNAQKKQKRGKNTSFDLRGKELKSRKVRKRRSIQKKEENENENEEGGSDLMFRYPQI